MNIEGHLELADEGTDQMAGFFGSTSGMMTIPHVSWNEENIELISTSPFGSVGEYRPLEEDSKDYLQMIRWRDKHGDNAYLLAISKESIDLYNSDGEITDSIEPANEHLDEDEFLNSLIITDSPSEHVPRESYMTKTKTGRLPTGYSYLPAGNSIYLIDFTESGWVHCYIIGEENRWGSSGGHIQETYSYNFTVSIVEDVEENPSQIKQTAGGLWFRAEGDEEYGCNISPRNLSGELEDVSYGETVTVPGDSRFEDSISLPDCIVTEQLEDDESFYGEFIEAPSSVLSPISKDGNIQFREFRGSGQYLHGPSSSGPYDTELSVGSFGEPVCGCTPKGTGEVFFICYNEVSDLWEYFIFDIKEESITWRDTLDYEIYPSMPSFSVNSQEIGPEHSEYVVFTREGLLKMRSPLSKEVAEFGVDVWPDDEVSGQYYTVPGTTDGDNYIILAVSEGGAQDSVTHLFRVNMGEQYLIHSNNFLKGSRSINQLIEGEFEPVSDVEQSVSDFILKSTSGGSGGLSIIPDGESYLKKSGGGFSGGISGVRSDSVPDSVRVGGGRSFAVGEGWAGDGNDDEQEFKETHFTLISERLHRGMGAMESGVRGSSSVHTEDHLSNELLEMRSAVSFKSWNEDSFDGSYPGPVNGFHKRTLLQETNRLGGENVIMRGVSTVGVQTDIEDIRLGFSLWSIETGTYTSWIGPEDFAVRFMESGDSHVIGFYGDRTSSDSYGDPGISPTTDMLNWELIYRGEENYENAEFRVWELGDNRPDEPHAVASVTLPDNYPVGVYLASRAKTSSSYDLSEARFAYASLRDL